MTSKFTKEYALKHIEEGDFDFIFNNLEKFGELNPAVVKKLIKEGYGYDLLDEISEIDISLAYVFLDSGIDISDHLDKFSGEKSSKLALKIIENDSELGTYNIIHNLDKFNNLDKEVAKKLAEDDYGDECLENLDKFCNVNTDLARVISEYGVDITGHLDKFSGEKSSTLADAILKSSQEFGSFWLTQCLKKFTGLNQDIAEQLIDRDESYDVAENLKSFEKLNVSIAYKLLEKGEDIFDNLDNFIVTDYSELAIKIIESGSTYELVQHFEKFPKLNRQVAELLISDNYGYEVLENLEKFSDVDISLAILLSRSGESLSVLENLTKFSGKKSSELALVIIEDISEVLFVDYLPQFKSLDKEVAAKLLEYNFLTSNVFNNINSFDEAATEYILSLHQDQTSDDEHAQADQEYERSKFYDFDETNYYTVLGINFDADADEVKAAFRKLASNHHPDKGGSEAGFKMITEAYAILKNKEKRGLYDTQLRYQQNTTSAATYASDDSEPADTTSYNYNEQGFSENNQVYKNETQPTGKSSSFFLGVVLLSIGIIITFGSYAYASSNGGSYAVTFGFIIYGLYLIFKESNFD